MHPAEESLTLRIQTALSAAFGPEHQRDAQLRPATRPEFGHYQTSAALQLAKPLGLSPRQVAEQLLGHLEVEDICLPPQLAGVGFINFTIRAEYLAANLKSMLGNDRLGVPHTSTPQRVVIDYSSPNVAKEMHVGHLRSTVIGDALARVLSYAGHTVVRQNHIGDWGTQFGMLIEQLFAEGHDGVDLDLAGLDQLYQRARGHFDADPTFASTARRRVVALQAGDTETLELWRDLVAVSVDAFEQMYHRLGALLEGSDVAGESSYNDALPGVVADLELLGLLRISEGAKCAFPSGFVGRDGTPLPVIVQKSDGGFGYAATDLAAIRHRVHMLAADRLVYVVDARQALHFQQAFAVATQASWLPERVVVQHVAFGTVLGGDGKPFKTRSGQTVRLSLLLDEAENKAAAVLEERGSDLQEPERAVLARSIGIGAVKYADLVNDLGRDYVFALNRMVALEGNTGPYLQYAHARLCSLLAKANSSTEAPSTLRLEEPAEQRLTLLLIGFGSVVNEVATHLEPHRLCGHLFGVASALSVFYENCPVLKAEEPSRSSRLALCRVTRDVLATGLDLLGIDAPARM